MIATAVGLTSGSACGVSSNGDGVAVTSDAPRVDEDAGSADRDAAVRSASRDAGRGRQPDASPARDARTEDAARTADSGTPTHAPDASISPAKDASSPEPPEADVVYDTEYWVGGLWHLNVVRIDRTAGNCVRVLLGAPSTNSNTEVELPPNWSIQRAEAIVTDDSCEYQDPDGTDRTIVRGLMESGRVAWRTVKSEVQPCSLDIDLQVLFPEQEGIPARVHLRAQDLPVDCQ